MTLHPTVETLLSSGWLGQTRNWRCGPWVPGQSLTWRLLRRKARLLAGMSGPGMSQLPALGPLKPSPSKQLHETTACGHSPAGRGLSVLLVVHPAATGQLPCLNWLQPCARDSLPCLSNQCKAVVFTSVGSCPLRRWTTMPRT